jgi:hypothetical protein
MALDPTPIEQALALGGEHRKKAIIALREYIARCSEKELLELIRKLEGGSLFDQKRERSRT